MDIDWKRPAIVAVIAFFVAVISAAFGRVGFGALLLRALLGSIVFGGIAVGVEMIARKFLPELFTPASVASGSTSEERVDITLDEENPHDASTGEQPSAKVDFDSDETAEDVSDIPAFSDNEEVEELETVDEGSTGASDAPSGDGALPSFEDVETTFDTAAAHITDSDSGPSVAASRNDSSIDILGEDQDPEVVARAVRTLLKRDEG